MSFFKDTNYSGSRKYDRDLDADNGVGNFRVTFSFMVAWVSLQLQKLARPGSAAAPSKPKEDRGFTLLGAEERTISAFRPISDLFPLAAPSENVSRLRHEN